MRQASWTSLQRFSWWPMLLSSTAASHIGQQRNTGGTSRARWCPSLLKRTTTRGCPLLSITNWCWVGVGREDSSRGSVLKWIFSLVRQPIWRLSRERLPGDPPSWLSSWLLQTTSEQSRLKLSFRLISRRFVRVSRSLSLTCVWFRLFSGDGFEGSSRLRLASRSSRRIGSSMPQCSQTESMYSRSMRLLSWLCGADPASWGSWAGAKSLCSVCHRAGLKQISWYSFLSCWSRACWSRTEDLNHQLIINHLYFLRFASCLPSCTLGQQLMNNKLKLNLRGEHYGEMIAKFKNREEQTSLEEALVYLKLRELDCDNSRALIFAKKKERCIDGTIERDGPPGFRKLDVLKPESKLTNVGVAARREAEVRGGHRLHRRAEQEPVGREAVHHQVPPGEPAGRGAAAQGPLALHRRHRPPPPAREPREDQPHEGGGEPRARGPQHVRGVRRRAPRPDHQELLPRGRAARPAGPRGQARGLLAPHLRPRPHAQDRHGRPQGKIARQPRDRRLQQTQRDPQLPAAAAGVHERADGGGAGGEGEVEVVGGGAGELRARAGVRTGRGGGGEQPADPDAHQGAQARPAAQREAVLPKLHPILPLPPQPRKGSQDRLPQQPQVLYPTPNCLPSVISVFIYATKAAKKCLNISNRCRRVIRPNAMNE